MCGGIEWREGDGKRVEFGQRVCGQDFGGGVAEMALESLEICFEDLVELCLGEERAEPGIGMPAPVGFEDAVRESLGHLLGIGVERLGESEEFFAKRGAGVVGGGRPVDAQVEAADREPEFWGDFAHAVCEHAIDVGAGKCPPVSGV